jgi:hypothetical protein
MSSDKMNYILIRFNKRTICNEENKRTTNSYNAQYKERKMASKSLPELSIDSTTLYNQLAKLKIDEFISYSELNKLITRDVQDEARPNLTTARNMARRNNGIVLGVIVNQGLKRLKDEEIVGIGMKSIRSIGKASRKAMKQLICVKDFDNMPSESQTKHNTLLSVLGVVNTIVKPKKIALIESKISTAHKKLSIQETLDFFTNKS